VSQKSEPSAPASTVANLDHSDSSLHASGGTGIRKNTVTAIPGKLISRITFPDNWTSAKGACQIAPEETVAAVIARMVSKHGGASTEKYALFFEGEVLDDNLSLTSRFGSDSLVALAIKPKLSITPSLQDRSLGKEKEAKSISPTAEGGGGPAIVKIALPDDWACRTAAYVLGPEDSAATVVAKMALKHGSSMNNTPGEDGEEYILTHEGEAIGDTIVLSTMFDKTSSFAIKPKRVQMRVIDEQPRPSRRTSRFSLSKAPEEAKVPELIAKVVCPVHWACSVASQNVYAGETAKSVVRKLSKMYAGDGEKYALMYDDEMVDADTVLASRFRGVVNFSILPSFGGSWF
jgi:hypothetical protein